MPFGGYIVNRVHPSYGNVSEIYMRMVNFLMELEGNTSLDLLELQNPQEQKNQKNPKNFWEKLDRETLQSLLTKVLVSYQQNQTLAEIDQMMVQELQSFSGKNIPITMIPIFDVDIHDLEGLREINRHIFEVSEKTVRNLLSNLSNLSNLPKEHRSHLP